MIYRISVVACKQGFSFTTNKQVSYQIFFFKLPQNDYVNQVIVINSLFTHPLDLFTPLLPPAA